MKLPSNDVPVSGIEYEELEIEVSRCLCGQQEVRILDSVYNRPRERFEPSYDAKEMNRRLERLDELFLLGDEAEGERRILAESIGKDLYAALLPGQVRQTFSMSLAALRRVRAYRNVGLRLRLSFGEAGLYVPEIVGLPWELLAPQTRRSFQPAPGRLPSSGSSTSRGRSNRSRSDHRSESSPCSRRLPRCARSTGSDTARSSTRPARGAPCWTSRFFSSRRASAPFARCSPVRGQADGRSMSSISWVMVPSMTMVKDT